MTRQSTYERLHRSPLDLLHRVGQYAHTLFLSEISARELTLRQFLVLVAVSQDEGLSQAELVEKTGIDRSTTTELIRRLVRKGLLQRRRTKEDARAYAVKLTEQGWLELQAAAPAANRVNDELFAVLPTRQAKELVNNLQTIVKAFGSTTSEQQRASAE